MLSERIREQRMLRHISQVDLAKALNVTKQSVSNWENDNILPSIDILVRIARFFDVSTDYMLGLENRETLDVTGLSPAHIAHLRLIANDLRTAASKEL